MQKTPFFPLYHQYDAKVIDFFGWNLPVRFSGIIEEHLTVRNKVGLFDVSHMGELMVQGSAAAQFLDYVFTNSVASLPQGSVRYSPFCDQNGGTVDDVLIYRLAADRFLLVVNASNITKDYESILAAATDFQVSIENISPFTGQLAVQGPNAAALLADITRPEVVHLKYYQFMTAVPLANTQVTISRTGYTGEDGFEIYLPPEAAPDIWELVMSAGQKYGIRPIGLGARDTLRLEAGLPLYGHELGAAISPLEAGLGRFIDFAKDNFRGRTALKDQADQPGGPPRRLIGLEMIDRGIPRSGCPVWLSGEPVGEVTSGSYAPFLDKNIAMVLLSRNAAGAAGFEVEIRGKLLAARPTPLPFYKRRKGEKP